MMIADCPNHQSEYFNIKAVFPIPLACHPSSFHAKIKERVFVRRLDEAAEDGIFRMMYGATCFAMLLSFTGTVLGGLWADDSWGRFWGWDPKENGALMIVIWNALILHAKYGRMIRHRGFAVMAVFGSVVTAWSWFGVNQLSIGLHSYGFTDSATRTLTIFVITQTVLCAAGAAPSRKWKSGCI